MQKSIKQNVSLIVARGGDKEMKRIEVYKNGRHLWSDHSNEIPETGTHIKDKLGNIYKVVERVITETDVIKLFVE